MSVNNYLELQDGCRPVKIQSVDSASYVISNIFSAKSIGEIDFEFKFDYNVPTKKVKLSLLQVQDLLNFYKIYIKENPDWADDSARLVKIEDLK